MHLLIAIAFPLFFTLHGLNENFGLLRTGVVAGLFAYYVLISLLLYFIAKWIMKEQGKTITFMFVLLCVFFFFGAVKDLIMGWGPLSQYKVFLPLVIAFVFVCWAYIKKAKGKFDRASRFIPALVGVFLIVEMVSLIYNAATHKEKQRDLGDIDHSVIKKLSIPANGKKPIIVWVVLDEYSGGTGLKNGWNYTNPFDSILRSRHFFVADSARSPYNYTHYSLVSTLDMTYLSSLKDSSVIGFRDIVRGNISLRNTNVINFLESSGYDVVNESIYNVDGHPTGAREYFVDADWKLVDNQTMPGRIRQDIGWLFSTVFARITEGNPAAKARAFYAEASYRQQLLQKGLQATAKAAAGTRPTILMFHYMLTHEPFLYKDDGTIDVSVGFGVYPDKYLASIKYANRALTGFVDSLQRVLKGRESVIVIQGDHGFKFEEHDPLYKQEGCSIFYAIYCSDLQYPGWSGTINSVNGFRLLFNKYFLTNLPMLENRSYNLIYR